MPEGVGVIAVPENLRRIRAATIDDAEAIARVHVASWQAAYRGLLPQAFLDSMSAQRGQQNWTHILTWGAQDVRVAELAGDIGGFIATGAPADDPSNSKVGELWANYLLPDWRGTGTGSALHQAGIDALASRFDEAILWVLAGNARARAFYERHGWHADGARKTATIGGAAVDEVRYRRRLRPGPTGEP